MTIDAITDLSAFEAGLAAELDADLAADLDRALSETALEQLFHGAHTPTAFAATPVPDEVVRRVVELARWAPTALDTSPLRIVLAQSPQARERLVADMAEGNRAKTAGAPVVAILAADTRFHEELPRLAPHAAQAAVGFEADPTGREAVATYNAALQAAYLILAARGLGLDVAPMAGFDKDAVARDFFPDGEHRSWCSPSGTPRPARSARARPGCRTTSWSAASERRSAHRRASTSRVAATGPAGLMPPATPSADASAPVVGAVRRCDPPAADIRSGHTRKEVVRSCIVSGRVRWLSSSPARSAGHLLCAPALDGQG